MKLLPLAATTLLLTTGIARANEFEDAMRGFFEAELASMRSDPVLIDAARAQNAVTAGYDSARIEALDQAWQAEVGAAERPTVEAVLGAAASEHLRAQVEAYGGRVTEIIVMDALGLNVAASDVTSDYWQGDEAKFTETFGAGAESVHFGEIDFDESSQRYQGQISMTLSDPDTGAPIGAVTVGVDAEALM